MISGNRYNIKVFNKKDLFKTTLDNRLVDVQKTWNYYLSQGYELYDLTSQGSFAGLATTSYPTGKYMTYWSGAIGTSGYLLNSNYFTGQDHVVITGVKGRDRIESYDNDLKVNMIGTGSKNYSHKALFYALNFTANTSQYPFTANTLNLDFKNCKISRLGTYGSFTAQGAIFENCHISIPEGAGFAGYLGEGTINNCIIENNSTSSFTSDRSADISGMPIVHNTIIRNWKEIDGFQQSLPEAFRNVFLQNISDFEMYGRQQYPIFIDNSNVTSFISSYNNMLGVRFIPSSTNLNNFIFGNLVLNEDGRDAYAVDGNYDVEYVIDNTQFFNLGTKVNYTLTFKPNMQVKDGFKKFSKDKYYYVERDDFDEQLATSSSPTYVYDAFLYKSTVPNSTSKYDYNNDENFLMDIHKVGSSSETATVEYFNNSVINTKLSDREISTLYQVDKCYQIWEIDSMSNLKEIHKDKITRQGITNGPLSGSIKFNNLDNELLEKR